MINTNEYEQKFGGIITEWQVPQFDSHGEQVLLMDGVTRLVRKDGRMCITLLVQDGTSAVDAEFRHETALMDETKGFALSKPKESVTSELQAVSEDTKALITSSVSENTLRKYRFWSREIEKWLEGRSLTDALLAEYITDLYQAGKSPATISQAVAAVRWMAKHTPNPPQSPRRQGEEAPLTPPQAGGRSPVVGEITTRTLAGIRREGKNRGRGQVDGLNWSDVERVCAFCEMDNSIAGLRDSALIRLMSDCLLRVSEAVAVNCGDLKDKTLIVKSSKTDQEGIGEQLYVTSDTRRIIKRYRETAGITQGALFRQVRKGDHIQTGRLSARSARRQITYWAEMAGVEGFISGHSLRVGSAVSLAQAGASVVDMQVAGRWKSSQMPAHYAKAERGAIARFKEKKGR